MGAFYGQPEPGPPLLEIPTYNCAPQSFLDPLREFFLNGYVWHAAVVPRPDQQPVPALGQIEDRICVPGGSWLVGFSGVSQRAVGFLFKVWDAGARAWCLCDRWDSNISGAQDQTDAEPLGHILPDPYCVLDPGQLQVSVSNLSVLTADMQLLLHFAMPAGRGRK